MILLSFLFIFWVIRVNSFAASNVRVEKDQRVIDTGPYAHVRHPMYAGRHLAVRRNAARARFVVVARPHPTVRARAVVAASRRGENPAGICPGYTEYMRRVRLSSGPVRVVARRRESVAVRDASIDELRARRVFLPDVAPPNSSSSHLLLRFARSPCGVNSGADHVPRAKRRRQRPICTEIPPVTPLRLLVEVARYPALPCRRTLDPKRITSCASGSAMKNAS